MIRNHKSYTLGGLLLILPLFWMSSSFAADGLGRLFFTERERSEIEQLRFNTSRISSSSNSSTQLLLPERITFNGVVIRSSGKNTAWINGEKNLHETSLPGLRVDVNNMQTQDSQIPVLIVNGGKQVYVSPGQHMNTSTGETLETYTEKNLYPAHHTHEH